MSAFKLSAEAKVYIPMQEELEKLRRWREKIYPGMSDHSIEHHQRGLLTPEEREEHRKRTREDQIKWINELSDENKELKEKIKNLEEKSEEDQKTITNLTKELEKKEEIIQENQDNYRSVIECLEEDMEIMREQNDGNAENCLRIIDEWQGRSIKLNWILKEMEKVGAIKGDHEWAQDLRHSIEFPNDDGINLGDSIFQDIPLNVIQNNLPSHLDSHMEVVDEDIENQRIEEWSEEASSFELGKRIYACLKIQKFWRKKKKTQFWIDSETDNVFGDMFEEDERAWSLEYLESSWKRLYRNHYNLGLFDRIPGPITLSYNDFVCLSRGSLY